MPGIGDAAFNPNAAIERVLIGRGGIEVVRVDDVLLDPGSVVAFGLAQSYSRDPGNLYPGFRAALPDSFSNALRGWLASILRRNIDRDSSFFSVVATASEDLLPIQCIPHFDSTDPNLFAAVIYLCDERFSGTAFYRHRSTGYEEITAENVANYRLALNTDMRVHGVPARQYISGDTPQFETLFVNELRFNGAIVYPGRVLHAARIGKNFRPPANRSEWRLTVTALVHARYNGQ